MRITDTHWRQAGVWMGWRTVSEVGLVVELWVPHGQDAGAWADRLTNMQAYLPSRADMP